MPCKIPVRTTKSREWIYRDDAINSQWKMMVDQFWIHAQIWFLPPSMIQRFFFCLYIFRFHWKKDLIVSYNLLMAWAVRMNYEQFILRSADANMFFHRLNEHIFVVELNYDKQTVNKRLTEQNQSEKKWQTIMNISTCKMHSAEKDAQSFCYSMLRKFPSSCIVARTIALHRHRLSEKYTFIH